MTQLPLQCSYHIWKLPNRDGAPCADATETSYGRTCIQPYQRIGAQCLFFSQPHAAWGIDETWEQAYANFYDAVATCRKHGGDLAGSVEDYGAALR